MEEEVKEKRVRRSPRQMENIKRKIREMRVKNIPVADVMLEMGKKYKLTPTYVMKLYYSVDVEAYTK